MAFLAINGHEIPSPKRGVRPTVTTVVDSARNANGVVIAQRVGRDQYKIDSLEWSWLSAQEWSTILALLQPFFVHITFTDPVTNAFRTLLMYPGDRTAEPYWVDDNGQPTYYRNCKVNFIDTGA